MAADIAAAMAATKPRYAYAELYSYLDGRIVTHIIKVDAPRTLCGYVPLDDGRVTKPNFEVCIRCLAALVE